MDDDFYYFSPSGKVVTRMGLPEGEIARLRAENERLRAALKPLAAIPLWTDTYPDGPDMDPTGRLLITAADVMAARSALGNEQKARQGD